MSLHNEYVVDSDRPGSTDWVRGEGWVIPGANLFFDNVDPAAWPANYGPGDFLDPTADNFLLYGLPRYKQMHEVMARNMAGMGKGWTAQLEYWLLDSLPDAGPGLTILDYLACGQRERRGTIAEQGGTISMEPLCEEGTHWKFLLVRLLSPAGFANASGDPDPLTVRVISWNNDENERARVEMDKSQGYVTP
jgi:hypothetical protein